MKSNDIIMINVTGTNGARGHTKTLTEKFDGEGRRLNNDGQPDGSVHRLRNLPVGGGAGLALPAFPQAEFQRAIERGDAQRVKEIQVAYAAQIQEREQRGGGSDELAIAKSVLAYCKEFHGFREEGDGDFFIMTLQDLDVEKIELKTGDRVMYQVTGTAVFGV